MAADPSDRPLRIVQINVEHGRGGAAVVMQRLHRAFVARGCDARMMVRLNNTESADSAITRLPPTSRLRFLADRLHELTIGLHPRAYPASHRLAQIPPTDQADIIQLHNLHGGYFNHTALPALTRQKTVVWTLHDMWPLTGGCAQSLGCTRWQTGCHTCPLLQPGQRDRFIPRPPWRDTTRREWQHKRQSWQQSRLVLVTPSRWLHTLVSRSTLAHLPCHHIPHGVDTARFAPATDRATLRRQLGLPPDQPVLMCAAQDHKNRLKGFPELLAALRTLPEALPLTLLVTGDPALIPAEIARRFTVIAPGYVADEKRLAALYGCADLFVLPTMAENQPLVILEALACGVPVVAFGVGGVPELVRSGETGLLARAGDSADLGAALLTLLQNPAMRHQMGRQARDYVLAQHTLAGQADRYLALYRGDWQPARAVA